MKAGSKTRFYFPREPLLIEVERRCTFPDCGARNRVGLTKLEAIEYRGFDCSQCQRWNDDQLNGLDMPDSWSHKDTQTESN